MKNSSLRLLVFIAGISLAISSFAQTADITPKSVLDVMQQVADWQLANPSKHPTTDWTQGAGYAGMMALAGISGDTKYRDAMLAMATNNGWKPGGRRYHADDQCVGQTYAELYFLWRDPKMLAQLQARFDDILANPSDAPSLDFKQPDKKALEQWSWCDSLFMAPPAWIRLSAATGDAKYMDFAVKNWWRTSDYLYDKDEHLFFRDSTYFKKAEANGKKVFWARGNGWVMGGLVRVLQYLPMNHPDRARFEQQFKDMAAAVVKCQQPDGLWHSSLLDPDSFPLKETSGSGFFTYALAWGMNQGLLDRAQYEPAVQKAWAALVGCVDTDGKLTHVQPVGADPKKFDENATEVYGTGAFLLAGSEIYRMAALAKPFIKVTVSNPAKFYRSSETVELNVEDMYKVFGTEYPRQAYEKTGHLQRVRSMAVMDGISSRILPSQTYVEPNFPWKYIFQVDLAPGESRTYYILDGSALAAKPQTIVKTYARYVPERHEDFAWESDRIAHRIFGKALETWKAEPLTSSGYDVWVKRTRGLVVDHMYAAMNFFDLEGPAQDDFKVGKTRGDGGLGIWKDGKLYVSGNWVNYKIFTTGPLRAEFELSYAAWDAAGRKVSETKRFSIDAGSNLSRVESTLSSDDNSPLQLGIGLGERPGANSFVQDGAPEIAAWQNDTAKGLFVQNKDAGWMTYWQPQDFNKGVTAVAFILPKGSIDSFTTDIADLPPEKTAAPTKTMGEGQPALRNQLAIANAEANKPFVYYAGAGWSESGDFPNAKAWNDYVRNFAERIEQPLQVNIGN